jgi:hypothetical protein
MIRPFELTDSFSLFQCAASGLPLDSRQSSIHPSRSFRRALLGRIFPQVHPETFVAYSAGSFQGFAQYCHSPGKPLAHLLRVSPESFFANSCAPQMLEALAAAAGARHAHYLIAESETHSEAYALLRKSGFAVYARQTVWRAEHKLSAFPAEPAGVLRPIRPSDQPALTGLYASIVPALVQQIETPPTTEYGWALFEENELVGYFQFSSGGLGAWVDPFFHPSARHAAEWLSRLLYDLLDSGTAPLYVCVRSYQEWMGTILQDLGFVCAGDQSVLARRFVAPVAVAQPLQLQVVEGGAPPVTTMTPPSSSLHEAYDSTPHHR